MANRPHNNSLKFGSTSLNREKYVATHSFGGRELKKKVDDTVYCDPGDWIIGKHDHVRKRDQARNQPGTAFVGALTHGLIPNSDRFERKPGMLGNEFVVLQSYGVDDPRDLDECRRQFSSIVAATRTFRHVATNNPIPSWDPNDVRAEFRNDRTGGFSRVPANHSATNRGGFNRAIESKFGNRLRERETNEFTKVLANSPEELKFQSMDHADPAKTRFGLGNFDNVRLGGYARSAPPPRNSGDCMSDSDGSDAEGSKLKGSHSATESNDVRKLGLRRETNEPSSPVVKKFVPSHRRIKENADMLDSATSSRSLEKIRSKRDEIRSEADAAVSWRNPDESKKANLSPASDGGEAWRRVEGPKRNSSHSRSSSHISQPTVSSSTVGVEGNWRDRSATSKFSSGVPLRPTGRFGFSKPAQPKEDPKNSVTKSGFGRALCVGDVDKRKILSPERSGFSFGRVHPPKKMPKPRGMLKLAMIAEEDGEDVSNTSSRHSDSDDKDSSSGGSDADEKDTSSQPDDGSDADSTGSCDKDPSSQANDGDDKDSSQLADTDSSSRPCDTFKRSLSQPNDADEEDSSSRLRGGFGSDSFSRTRGGFDKNPSSRFTDDDDNDSPSRARGGFNASSSSRSRGGFDTDSSSRARGGFETGAFSRARGGFDDDSSFRSRGGFDDDSSFRSRGGFDDDSSSRFRGGFDKDSSLRSRGGFEKSSSLRPIGGFDKTSSRSIGNDENNSNSRLSGADDGDSSFQPSDDKDSSRPDDDNDAASRASGGEDNNNVSLRPRGGFDNDSSSQPRGGFGADSSSRSRGGFDNDSSSRPRGGLDNDSSSRPRGGFDSDSSSRSRGGFDTDSSSRPRGGFDNDSSFRSRGGFDGESSSRLRGGFDDDSSSRPRGGFDSDSSSRSRGGFDNDSSSRLRGGFDNDSSSRPRGGFDNDSSFRSRGGFDSDSSSRPRGGFDDDSSSRLRGGFDNDSSSRPRGGFDSDASSRPRGGFDNDSFSRPRGGFDTDSSSRPRGGFDSDASSRPRGGFDSDSSSRPRGGFDNDSFSRPRGGFDADSSSRPRGGFDSDSSRPRGGFDSDSSRPRGGFDSDSSRPRGGFDSDSSRPHGGFDADSSSRPRGGFGNAGHSSDADVSSMSSRGGFGRPLDGSRGRGGFSRSAQLDALSKKGHCTGSVSGNRVRKPVDMDPMGIFKQPPLFGRDRITSIAQTNEVGLDGYRGPRKKVLPSVGPSYADVWESVVDLFEGYRPRVARGAYKHELDSKHAKNKLVKDAVLLGKALLLHNGRMPPGTTVVSHYILQDCNINENIHFSLFIHGARILLEEMTRKILRVETGIVVPPITPPDLKIQPMNFYDKVVPLKLSNLPIVHRMRLLEVNSINRRISFSRYLRNYDNFDSDYGDHMLDSDGEDELLVNKYEPTEFYDESELTYLKEMIDSISDKLSAIKEYQLQYEFKNNEYYEQCPSTRVQRIYMPTRRRGTLVITKAASSVLGSHLSFAFCARSRKSIFPVSNVLTYPLKKRPELPPLPDLPVVSRSATRRTTTNGSHEHRVHARCRRHRNASQLATRSHGSSGNSQRTDEEEHLDGEIQRLVIGDGVSDFHEDSDGYSTDCSYHTIVEQSAVLDSRGSSTSNSSDTCGSSESVTPTTPQRQRIRSPATSNSSMETAIESNKSSHAVSRQVNYYGLMVNDFYHMMRLEPNSFPYVDLSAMLPAVAYRPFDAYDPLEHRLVRTNSLTNASVCLNGMHKKPVLPDALAHRSQSSVEMSFQSWVDVDITGREFRRLYGQHDVATNVCKNLSIVQIMLNSYQFSCYAYKRFLRREHRPNFVPFMSPNLAVKGIDDGSLISGTLRINPRNMEEAYIVDERSGAQHPYLVYGTRYRNRALDGDFVVARVRKRLDWIVNENVLQTLRSGRRRMQFEESPGRFRDLFIDRNDPLSFIRDEDRRDECRKNILEMVPCPKKLPNTLISYTTENLYRIGAQFLYFAQYMNDALVLSGSTDIAENIKDLIFPVDSNVMSVFRYSGVLNEDGSYVPTRSNFRETLLYRPNTKQFHFKSVKRLMRPRYYRDMQRFEIIPDVCLKKTAEIVLIGQRFHNCIGVGRAEPVSRRMQPNGVLKPRDVRFPRIILSGCQLPVDFKARQGDIRWHLYIAQIKNWHVATRFPRGEVLKRVGLSGHLLHEITALLEVNRIDNRPFSDGVLREMASFKRSIHKARANRNRIDLTHKLAIAVESECRAELPTAYSIVAIKGKDIPTFEVSVHVVDVACYVPVDSEMDKWARERGTAIILHDKYVPMFPAEVITQYCSLRPGLLRNAVTISFHVDAKGNLSNYLVYRSKIMTATALTSDRAQLIIRSNNMSKKELEDCVPRLHNGFTTKDVCSMLNLLARVCKVLHRRRLDRKAFFVERPQATFCNIEYEHKNDKDILARLARHYLIHDMINELHICANHVATRVMLHSRKQPMVYRRSAPFSRTALSELNKVLVTLGLPPADDCLGKYIAYFSSIREHSPVYGLLLNYLFARIHPPATYITSEEVSESEDYNHANIAENEYMRFTAPVRRYTDLVSQRLLLASLGYIDQRDYAPGELANIISTSAMKEDKLSKVNEELTNLYFYQFVKVIGPLDTLAVVVDIGEAWIDVILLKYFIVQRCYLTLTEVGVRRPPNIVLNPTKVALIYWDEPIVNKYRRIRSRGVTFGADKELPLHDGKQPLERVRTSNLHCPQTMYIGTVVRVFLEAYQNSAQIRARLLPTSDEEPFTMDEIKKVILTGEVKATTEFFQGSSWNGD